jgi:hypothetical protein
MAISLKDQVLKLRDVSVRKDVDLCYFILTYI